MANVNRAVCECYRENRVSKKSGSVYQVLVVCFENGYKREDIFLSNEQQYILKDIVPCINPEVGA